MEHIGIMKSETHAVHDPKHGEVYDGGQLGYVHTVPDVDRLELWNHGPSEAHTGAISNHGGYNGGQFGYVQTDLGRLPNVATAKPGAPPTATGGTTEHGGNTNFSH